MRLGGHLGRCDACNTRDAYELLRLAPERCDSSVKVLHWGCSLFLILTQYYLTILKLL